MFWVYRYKGFSFTAARTVHTALVLAGQQGCSQADTGHLLLALVQTAQGTAADFLRRKRVTSTALAEHTAAHSIGPADHRHGICVFLNACSFLYLLQRLRQPA